MIAYRTHARYPGLWQGCLVAYSAEEQRATKAGQYAYNLAANWLHAEPTASVGNPAVKRWDAKDGSKLTWFGEGTAAGYGYAIVGKCPDLLQDWTFACWIVIESEVTGSPIVVRNSPQPWFFASVGQILELREYGVATRCTGSATLSLNTLYHVAATKRASTFTLYIDGQVDATNTSTPTGTASTTEDDLVLFDGQGVGFNRSFQGYREDLRIYNRCLSQSEIQLLARYRGVAYETRPQLWYAEAQAETFIPQLMWM